MTTRTQPIVRLGSVGCTCARAGVGAIGAFDVNWPQLGVGLLVGTGLGYVLFARE